jgi:hypothetical protein
MVARWFVFKTKNLNFGKMGRALDWKRLLYFMTIWYNLHPFGIVCGHWVYFSVFVYLDVWTKKNLATLAATLQVVSGLEA